MLVTRFFYLIIFTANPGPFKRNRLNIFEKPIHFLKKFVDWKKNQR